MDDELIKFKTAKLANEKGYCITTEGSYKADGGMHPTSSLEARFLAPTQSLLQRWLRKVHNIDVEPYQIQLLSANREIEMTDNEYSYKILVKGIMEFVTNDNEFETYEEALEKGLYTALNLLN